MVYFSPGISFHRGVIALLYKNFFFKDFVAFMEYGIQNPEVRIIENKI